MPISPITELMQFDERTPVGVFNCVYNTMVMQAEECPYRVIFAGPWGFEPTIGAHEMREARGTAKAFVKQHPETETYQIWTSFGDRVEACDLVAPSDDDRALQALGWPNASEEPAE